MAAKKKAAKKKAAKKKPAKKAAKKKPDQVDLEDDQVEGRTVELQIVTTSNGWAIAEMLVDQANCRTRRDMVAMTEDQLIDLVAEIRWLHRDEAR